MVTERIPRKIFGSQPGTGRTTPISSAAPVQDPLFLALEQLDPLSEFAMLEIDPLSKMAAEMDTPDSLDPKTVANKDVKGNIFKDMDPWSSRKAGILSKYTTSEKLSIVTSFLYEGEKVVVKTQSTAVDKVQHRLEQLDSFEEGSQRKLNVSQAEYIGRIDQLNKELVSAWNSEQRVKALKIAIQCAKLLADTEVLPFYPSKFVLITDILDTFGKLVYERLRVKSDYYKPGSKTPTPLPEDFTPDMVPESAKETCLNWFHKIASIRELVPRLYVETALMKSYNFISSNECADGVLRITEMIHGIGNPLVAIYVRCYLCRVGINLMSQNSNYDFLYANFKAFLDSYQHLFSRCVKLEIAAQKMTMRTYASLYTPALDFILQAVVCTVNESVLADLLNNCKQCNNSSLILHSIMSSFKPSYVAERASDFVNMIVKCFDDCITLCSLLRMLGLCLNVCPPPSEQRRHILTAVWKYVSAFTNPAEYITCVEAWIQYIVVHFSNRDINIILGDIIEHMSPNRNFENFYNDLKIIVGKIVSNNQDFEMLLVMENFLPLIDLFQQEYMKVEVCKNILTNNFTCFTTNDPVTTNALMYLCTVLHDSVNALTPEDEYRQIGEILCNVIRKVDYGRDFEQQMNFYVEARGAFSNIDTVLAELVQRVNCLTVNTRHIVKGIHTRKTADFVRACAAYCFITIPSIVSEKTRLELYLLSGQVALFNQCLGQADACFKAVLSMLSDLQDVTTKSEIFLSSYIRQVLSTLLVVPDNPERGVLSLLKGLLNVIRDLDWNKQNCVLGSLYVNVIDLLSVMSQEEYSYHVDRVESNDSLYGSDTKFLVEINNMCSIIIGEILTLLKDLGICRRQSQLAIELFLRVALRGDLSMKSVSALALNLWQLSLKNGNADVKYMAKTKEYIRKRGMATNDIHLHQLLDKIIFQ
ncbi:unnamed protein product [Acanthoscelides obtectus]|uniref:VPS35 endosomal protein sorting factor-like n=1 Tax=Acanthoscelides obtectus TaxID=200917 RepID=A0A9P0LJZ1_ACAOB|nr:unnamed protein product [Acanthoscelides obtectus]CAK1650250.1 hypothetical protein AOBTE_LOCUS16716 [Acanthoscelides obtectus]